MEQLLRSLPVTYIIVSGSTNSQIRKQINDLPAFYLGQNGNHAIDAHHQDLWLHALTEREKQNIYEHISRVRPLITHAVPHESDLVEDRGSQISFSIYGHNAPVAAKRACDPNFSIRKSLLAAHPFSSDTVEVKMGGTTCLDYFKKGFHKGRNVHALIERMGWDPNACVYFGDALFPGGNDETVHGVISTVSVMDEEDTYQKLCAMFPQFV
jgi:HAD superfamily hydrolase (TIGR01484 family)